MIPWNKSLHFVRNQNPMVWYKTEIHFYISWLAELQKSSCHMDILFVHLLARLVVFSNRKGSIVSLFPLPPFHEYTEFVNVLWLLVAWSILTQHKYCKTTGKTNLLQRNQLMGIDASGSNSKGFLTNTGKKSVQEFKLCILERWATFYLDFQWVSWWYLQNHHLVQCLEEAIVISDMCKTLPYNLLLLYDFYT